MSRRLDVLKAVKDLIAAALPNADVIGLDNDDAIPTRPTPGGRVIVRSGDPGEPEIDLCPLTYNFEHEIPLELTGWRDGEKTSEEVLDEMMVPIGAEIERDRSLGGLCTWVEARSPLTDDVFLEGASPEDRADLVIVATYATTNPLT